MESCTKCQFEYEGRKCEETKIYGMTRCKCFCFTHFDTVKKDNIRRFNKGEEIPVKLIFTKKLDTAATFSRFAGQLTSAERGRLKDGN